MEEYTSYLSTLCKISTDDANNEVMTELGFPIYNFDSVKRHYINSLFKSEESCTSCDGILWNKYLKLLIEFKNGKKIDTKDIHIKVLNSLLILCDINGCNISDLKADLVFILVYNEEKNPVKKEELTQYEKKRHDEVQESINRDSICKYFCKNAKTEFVRYDLLKYKGLYFRDVHSYSQNEFEFWICKTLATSLFGRYNGYFSD